MKMNVHDAVMKLATEHLLHESLDRRTLVSVKWHIANCRRCLEELDAIIAVLTGEPSDLARRAEAFLTCAECREGLPAYAELAPVEAEQRYPLIAQHLQGCADCRAEYEVLYELVHETPAEVPAGPTFGELFLVQTCVESMIQLPDYVGHEIAGRVDVAMQKYPKLGRHLRACPACRRDHALLRDYVLRMRLKTPEPLPISAWAKVIGRWVGEVGQRVGTVPKVAFTTLQEGAQQVRQFPRTLQLVVSKGAAAFQGLSGAQRSYPLAYASVRVGAMWWRGEGEGQLEVLPVQDVEANMLIVFTAEAEAKNEGRLGIMVEELDSKRPAAGAHLAFYSQTGELLEKVTTNSEGFALLPYLTPGAYEVKVTYRDTRWEFPLTLAVQAPKPGTKRSRRRPRR